MTPRRMTPAMLLLVAAVLLPIATVHAQTTGLQTGGLRADPDAPVEVTADMLDLDQTAGTANFTGNVVVTQGEMKLTAPEILVEYAMTPEGELGDDVERITATGGVLMVTPTEAAEAQQAVYSPLKNEVVMTGEVLLTQGPNTLAGERLVVDLTTGVGQVEGRVRTILQTGGTEE